MWDQISGAYLCGVNIKKHREKVPIWRLCFVVSQEKKYTLGHVQEKMVWSIHGTILLTQ
jgi:hypothetical protein